MKTRAGWTAHDGKGMPVAASSSPAIMMRCGLTIPLGQRFADEWPSGWEWFGPPSGTDINAYCDEVSEFAAIPQLE